MTRWIEHHMNGWLFIGCIAGLVWPYWEWAPDVLVKLILMTATFIACFKMNMVEFKQLAWKRLSVLILLRYTVLAWVAYYVLVLFLPVEIALAAMLMVALPAGVSSPAITHLMGGQVTLAAIVTLVTTLLVPFSIPLLFSVVGSGSVTPDPLHLLETLTVILIVPCLLFLLLRKVRPIHAPLQVGIHRYGKSIVVLLTALMLAIVVGKQREFVLADIGLLSQMVVLTFAVLSLLLWIGWASGKSMARDQQIALATTSGFNNAALGVALAALHFSPMVVIVTVAAEISWAFLPFVMRWLMRE